MTLTSTLRTQGENQQALQAEIEWLMEAGQKSDSELQQMQDLCYRIELASAWKSLILSFLVYSLFSVGIDLLHWSFAAILPDIPSDDVEARLQ